MNSQAGVAVRVLAARVLDAVLHRGRSLKAEFANTPRAQPPNDAEQVFAASDGNHDGVVTKAEFVDGVLAEQMRRYRHFARARPQR